MKSKLFIAALAALALGACSDNGVVDVASNSSASGGSMGYVRLAINLPTQTSTKGANDVFDDGTADEYAVNDITLLLFSGSSEDDATYYAQYTLDNGTLKNYETTTDQITSKYAVTQKIDRPENATASDTIYALVLLNAGTESTDMLSKLTLTVGETTIVKLSQQQLTNIKASDIISSKGFYMCNAPLYTAKGGYTDPDPNDVKNDQEFTLVKIEPDNIYDTEDEALENPASNIYVERAVAKVTVDVADNFVASSTSLAVNNSRVKSAEVKAFTLDLTNETMYPVREVQFAADVYSYHSGLYDDLSYDPSDWPYLLESDKYRMVGGAEVGADVWRIYWGRDPNYGKSAYTEDSDGNRTYTNMNYLYGEDPYASGDMTDLKDNSGDQNPEYCLDNTFAPEYMNKAETTRAIIAVAITLQDDDGNDLSDNSFYVINDERSYIKTLAEVQAYVKKVIQSDEYYQEAEKLWTNGDDDLIDQISVSINETTSTKNATIVLSFGSEISSTDNWTDGKVPDVFSDTSNEYSALMETITSNCEVDYYLNGIAYYPVEIKHFGDESTPWSAPMVSGHTDDTKDTETNKALTSYPSTLFGTSRENNWMGRYGVLRNNWYNIIISDVTEVGTPTVPEAYDEPDDPLQSWLYTEINLLAWAKRQQSVSL
ncbi:MAG: Mfa1 fimbrilin C-terminal domain-containing protein [Prevotellaceae bacterium]|nr:Mfa1 fimbrilin C-terminal domain-containing protein [Prevotellaceae bacterium]